MAAAQSHWIIVVVWGMYGGAINLEAVKALLLVRLCLLLPVVRVSQPALITAYVQSVSDEM